MQHKSNIRLICFSWGRGILLFINNAPNTTGISVLPVVHGAVLVFPVVRGDQAIDPDLNLVTLSQLSGHLCTCVVVYSVELWSTHSWKQHASCRHVIFNITSEAIIMLKTVRFYSEFRNTIDDKTWCCIGFIESLRTRLLNVSLTHTLTRQIRAYPRYKHP